MKEKKTDKAKKNKPIKIVYASKAEVKKATKKCFKKYRSVFKELAKC